MDRTSPNLNQPMTSGMNPNAQDYYETLGVSRTATPEEITRAYKQMSLRTYPQQYIGLNQFEDADTTFQHISEAYQVLSDIERRRKYDEFMRNPTTQQRTTEFMKTQPTGMYTTGQQMPGMYTTGQQMPGMPTTGQQMPGMPTTGQQMPGMPITGQQMPGMYTTGQQMPGMPTTGQQMPGMKTTGQQMQGMQNKQMRPRRRHPHSFYFDDINCQVMDAMENFNNLMTKGFFSDFDLPMYGITTNMMTDMGRMTNEFFGQDNLNQFLKQNQTGMFQMARSVKQHTRVENGKRTTITEVKTVNPDGRVCCEVKEETDDGRGNKQVRYLDSMPQEERQKIKTFMRRQDMIGQGTTGQTHGQAMTKGQNMTTNMQGTNPNMKYGQAPTTNK